MHNGPPRSKSKKLLDLGEEHDIITGVQLPQAPRIVVLKCGEEGRDVVPREVLQHRLDGSQPLQYRSYWAGFAQALDDRGRVQ